MDVPCYVNNAKYTVKPFITLYLSTFSSFLLFLFLLPDVATLPTGAPAVEYTLGRGNENDIWMGKRDKRLSRVHAKISVKPA